MQWIFRLLALCAVAFAPVAKAAWLEARTGHFVITIDSDEVSARDFATRLERFDLALRRLYGLPDNPDRHANPVRVFALQERPFYTACRCWGALGFYAARAEGSTIFTLHMPKADRKAQPGSWSSQAVLLHEYSHHFMFSNYPIAYPYWFTEGFAEFNANVVFEENGAITLGIPANYRGEALKSGAHLSVQQFFDPFRYGFGARNDLLYGRGWLLTHYLVLGPHRKGQLAAYLAEINKGKDGLAAARAAFGDIDALYRELIAYGKGVIAPPLRIPPPEQAIEVRIRPLSKGEAAMMPIRTVALNGVGRWWTKGFAGRARDAAKPYPDDPVVQTQLGEAELLDDELDRAAAAADRALALRPGHVDALVLRGRVEMRRAVRAKATDPAIWSAARSWFIKANRAQPDAAYPLYLYYSSFKPAKAKPNAGAIKGLKRAHVLAPESSAIRVLLARQMLEEGENAAARALLQAIAYSPHRRNAENVARKAIEQIDAGKPEAAKAAMDGEKDEEGAD